MTITAKFPGTCPACGCAISPGTKVEWSRGSKARHVTCGASVSSAAPTPARSTRPRRSGKWTGCSCGSREDSYGDLIYSERNCASCVHDA
jgi:hypothetical protein